MLSRHLTQLGSVTKPSRPDARRLLAVGLAVLLLVGCGPRRWFQEELDGEARLWEQLYQDGQNQALQHAARTNASRVDTARNEGPRETRPQFGPASAATQAPQGSLPAILEQLRPLEQQDPARYAEIVRLLTLESPAGHPFLDQQKLALAARLAESYETNRSRHDHAPLQSGGPPAAGSTATTTAPNTAAPPLGPATPAPNTALPATTAVAGRAPDHLDPHVRPAVYEELPRAATPDQNASAAAPSKTQVVAQTEPSAKHAEENKSADAARAESPATAGNSAPNAPPAAVAERDWSALLDDAIRRLEELLRDESLRGEEATRAEEQLRLLYVVANKPRDALRPIESLDEPLQEYWKHQAHALLSVLDPEGKHASSRRHALTLRHVRTASDHLAEASTLDVRNLAFCSAVEAFGRYTEFPRAEFRADQEVLLYVEVANFTCDTRGQKFETELQGSYEILAGDGRRVASSVLPLDRQSSGNRRHDYFIAYPIYMPSRIAAGEYTLKLTIEDVKGQKSNSGTLTFRVRG